MLALALMAALVTGDIAENRGATMEIGPPATLNGEAHAPGLAPSASAAQFLEMVGFLGVGAVLFLIDLKRAPVALRISPSRLTLSWSF
jgi:hypothetical protein